jgi:subtilisin-like proprotein convertase family protein
MKKFLSVPAFVVATLFVCGPRADASSFANTTSISIRDTNTAVPYPSSITVSGLTGTVSTVTILLNGLSHGSPSDIEMLLVSPAGNKFVFFSDAGGVNQVSGLNIAFADSAESLVPSSSLTSGTFKPTDYGGSNLFASPAPAVDITGDLAAPYGTVTFSSRFHGADPNGVWSLYIVDDVSGASGTLAGGWTLTITTVPPLATVTTLQSSPNPSFDSSPSNTVVFSALVTSSGLPVTQGTVTFIEGASILMTNVALSAGGQAMYTNDS